MRPSSSAFLRARAASVRRAARRPACSESWIDCLAPCGVPLELYDAVVRMKAKVMYYNCFVAYGEPERKFAEKLSKSLKAKGISCWLYAMDAKVGERTWKEITEKRRAAERVIVLCSSKTLVRDGLLKEIEEQIDEDPDKIHNL